MGHKVLQTSRRNRLRLHHDPRNRNLPVTKIDHSFFLKIFPSKDSDSRAMALGEWESMRAMHLIVPGFVPKPLDYMSCETSSTAPDGTPLITRKNHLLYEFLPFIPDLQPSPLQMAQNLATLHMQSQSPTGKFGFPVPTFPGNLPQFTAWEGKWETFFSKSLRQALDQEIRANGRHPRLDALIPVLFDRVIPRLLRPLESGGRSVKPCLVHGDLWFGNSGLWHASPGFGLRAAIFDAACVYVHNECMLSFLATVYFPCGVR